MKPHITLDHDGTKYLVENGAIVTTLRWYGKRYDNEPERFIAYFKRKVRGTADLIITDAAKAAMEGR